MHETACTKCNAVSILPFHVAALDSLKANLNLINAAVRDLHRTVVTFRNRGHYAIIRFFHRTVVIAGNLGDAWSLPVRPILIERTVSRSRSSSRSSSIGRRTLLETRVHAIARSWPSAHLKRHWTAQTKRGRTHEPRSQCDQAAIAVLSLGNRLQSIGRRSMKDQDHDRGSIAARSWRDRGPIVAEIAAIWKPN